MKYAITNVVNGNFSIVSEHGEDKQAAIVAFHNRCAVLWNAQDVITATVKLVDENLDSVDGKKEFIYHAQPEPEPEPEEPENAEQSEE